MASANPGTSDLFLVDVVQVDDDRAGAYLRAIEELAVPVMTAAGASLESCRSAGSGLGVEVDIEVVWRVRDFAHWNLIRRNLVLDSRWYTWAQRAAGLRRGGTRRMMMDTFPPTPPGS
jgi:hypothetical protein